MTRVDDTQLRVYSALGFLPPTNWATLKLAPSALPHNRLAHPLAKSIRESAPSNSLSRSKMGG